MKKTLLTTAGLVLACGLALVGCDKNNGSSAASGKKSGLDVGIAMPETHVQRWVQDGKNLKDDVTKLGYNGEVAFGDADQAKQNQQISDFLTKGAKILIVGSVNEGVVSVVADAAADGVPVIAYDRLITGTDKYDYYITFDNFKVGQTQGQAIVDALALDSASEPKYITLFAGSPTDNNAKVFFDGAMDVLVKYIDSGKLVVAGPAPKKSSDEAFTKITTENWRADLAKTRMENLLSNDCKDITLDAVLAPNDTLARAILEACAADAKYAEKLPVLTGQDAETASIQAIKDGKQYMTVFKDTRQLAEGAALLAKAIMNGEKPNIPGARLDESSYDTGKKVVKAYLLEPIAVTKDNFQAVMIDSGYIPASDIQ